MNQTSTTVNASKHQGKLSLSAKFAAFWRECAIQKQLIFMVIPGVLIVLIFNYIPMYGAAIAFQKYDATKGVLGSEWVGLKYFEMFFDNPLAWRLIKNTFLLGFYTLLFSFPAPIILALLLDQVRNTRFKKAIQTISYFPHFISMVVIVGLIKEFFAIDGLFNELRLLLGYDAVSFLTKPEWFRTVFIGSGIWQGIGWGTIIYLAALSNVDPQLNEAATIDGANRWHKVKYISWPTILPTTTILLIFAISGILGSDFQKVLLMYSPANYSTADIIPTYVYREGLQGGRYEYTAAIGLLMNLVSCGLIIIANYVSRKISENSLW
jgi:putative aldouronate transport system permease protein